MRTKTMPMYLTPDDRIVYATTQDEASKLANLPKEHLTNISKYDYFKWEMREDMIYVSPYLKELEGTEEKIVDIDLTMNPYEAKVSSVVSINNSHYYIKLNTSKFEAVSKYALRMGITKREFLNSKPKTVIKVYTE